MCLLYQHATDMDEDDSQNMAPKPPKCQKMNEEFPEYCKHKCGRSFNKDGNNRENRHLKACSYRPTPLQKQKKISNFFTASASTHSSDKHGGSGFIGDVTDSVAGENECDSSVVVHDQEEGDLSIVNEARQTSCKGKEFLVPSPESASFYRNYPFHRHFTSNENYKLS